jgi:hypothetical protein
MKTLVGIFSAQADAAQAYSDLRSLNLHGDDLIVLSPEASLQQWVKPSEGWSAERWG